MSKQELVQQELERRFAGEYDSIGDLHSGIAVVERNDKFGVINKNGEIVIPLIYDFISDFRNNLAAAFIEDKGCFINTKGTQISPLIYDDIATEMYGQLNCPQFINGLVKVRVDGKYGFVNKLGEPVIPAKFDSAQDFANSSFCVVSQGTKWGIINKFGETVIDLKYDKIFEINKKGYITVEINGVVEIIDFSGKILSNEELEEMHRKRS
jgi:hypothetical protein